MNLKEIYLQALLDRGDLPEVTQEYVEKELEDIREESDEDEPADFI